MSLRGVRVLLLIALLAPGARAELLRYRFTAGETFRYTDHFVMAFEADANVGQRRRLQLRSRSTIEEKVTRVQGDVHTIEVRMTDNQTERTDETGETTKLENLGSPERIELAARGRIVSREDIEAEEEESPGSGFVTPLDEFAIVQQIFDALELPEDDVEPGAEWSAPITVNLTPGTDDKTEQKVDTKTTFARLVTVRGERCAELVTDFVIPLREPRNAETRELNIKIGGNIIGHLTTYFGIERGRAIVELATLGVHGSFTIAPPGAGQRLAVSGRLKCNIKTVLED